jgi:hypothetical protein
MPKIEMKTYQFAYLPLIYLAKTPSRAPWFGEFSN